MSETTEAVTDATLTPSASVGGASIAANAGAGLDAQRGSGLRKGIVAVVALALLFAVPFVANAYLVFVISLTMVYAVSTLGFNLLVGWSGQIGLAHAALFAIGAYGSAIGIDAGIPFLVTIPLAGIAAALLAVVIGFPAVRLRGFFLAIATLALGMAIVELITFARPLTGGGAGMNVHGVRAARHQEQRLDLLRRAGHRRDHVLPGPTGAGGPVRPHPAGGARPRAAGRVARRLAAALPAGRVRAVRVHRRRGGHALRTAADVHLPGDVRDEPAGADAGHGVRRGRRVAVGAADRGRVRRCAHRVLPGPRRPAGDRLRPGADGRDRAAPRRPHLALPVGPRLPVRRAAAPGRQR